MIGATEQDEGAIKERPVTPRDLAATIIHHLGVPPDAGYADPTGRPLRAVDEERVIVELV